VSHAHHEALPGYDERHVLHDGCGECEERSRAGLRGLLNLDREKLNLLFRRMQERKRDESVPGSGCDYRLMNALEELTTVRERLDA
jgi:hypothetical protein